MKRIQTAAVILIVILTASSAYAGEGCGFNVNLPAGYSQAGIGGDAGSGGVFGPAAVLKKGKFILGVEPHLFLSDVDNQFGVLGHARYGLMPSFELNGSLGVVLGKFYFRGGIDYQILPDKPGSVGLLMRAGGFMNNDGMGNGLDIGMMVGNQFKLVNIYGGLDMTFIVDPSSVTIANLVGGIHIPFQRKMAFVGEIGVNINNKNASYLSGGVLFYMN